VKQRRRRGIEVTASDNGRWLEGMQVASTKDKQWKGGYGVYQLISFLLISSYSYDVLPRFRNIRCFSFVKLVYLDIF
jgi:hypothetical protein